MRGFRSTKLKLSTHYNSRCGAQAYSFQGHCLGSPGRRKEQYGHGLHENDSIMLRGKLLIDSDKFDQHDCKMPSRRCYVSLAAA